MRFKDFIAMQESMTSTSCIAGFSRMSIPLIRRNWFEPETDKKKKKKTYKVPQIDESNQASS